MYWTSRYWAKTYWSGRYWASPVTSGPSVPAVPGNPMMMLCL